MVMENLFYGCNIENKFDLKGSERNRLVDPSNQQGEIVLLDENLVQSKFVFHTNTNKLFKYNITLLQCPGQSLCMCCPIAKLS